MPKIGLLRGLGEEEKLRTKGDFLDVPCGTNDSLWRVTVVIGRERMENDGSSLKLTSYPSFVQRSYKGRFEGCPTGRG